MNIAFDCDETILDTTAALRAHYLARHPGAVIPENTYSSRWDVFGRGAAAVAGWKEFIGKFQVSDDFMKIPPLPGAVDAIRRLKGDGHNLFVLSNASDDPNVCVQRAAHLENVLGAGVINRVVCIESFESKKEKLAQLCADVLVDDGCKNIGDAIDMGIHAILLKGKENAEFVNMVQTSDDKDFAQSFWNYDFPKLRAHAKVANGWPDVVKIVQGLS